MEDSVWGPSISLLAVVLPILLGFWAVYASATLSRRNKVILFSGGIVCGLLVFGQQSFDRQSHQAELKKQQDANDVLQRVINENGIRNAQDMGYLKAKLEDERQIIESLMKFAPAIMRQAESTSEIAKSLNEARIKSDSELYRDAMAVVAKIQSFSKKFSNAQEANREASLQKRNSSPQISPAERAREFSEEAQRSTRLYMEMDNEFRTTIWPEAVAVYAQLSKRVAPPPMGVKEDADFVLKTGSLAGVHPELALASYLQAMAYPLRPK